jgi:hypothetical protein
METISLGEALTRYRDEQSAQILAAHQVEMLPPSEHSLKVMRLAWWLRDQMVNGFAGMTSSVCRT